MINENKWYLLGLVLATTLSTNMQAVNALTIEPVVSSESRTASLSMKTIVTPATPSVMLISSVTSSLQINNYTDATEISADINPDGQALLMLANEPQNLKDKKTSNALTNSIPNSSTSKPSGSLVSTSYNTVSMLRTMDDLQNIGYLGMNDVSAEPISDALTRELKVTTQIAFVPDHFCANLPDLKLQPTCQNKNEEKTAMPMIQDRAWSAQMSKDFSFWQTINNSPQKASK